jgi:hypothetical protein
LNEREGDLLRDKLGYHWKQATEQAPKLFTLRRMDVRESEILPGEVLRTSLNDLSAPTVSPDGTTVTFLELDGFAKRSHRGDLPFQNRTLWIAKGKSPPRILADYLEFAPDWSFDGKYLSYASSGNDRMDLYPLVFIGAATATVDASPPEAAPEASSTNKEAAFVLSPFARAVFATGDRILFAAAETNLPMVSKEPSDAKLFTIDLKTQTAEKLSHIDLPKEAAKAIANGSYVRSPDRDKLAVVDERGFVWIVDLITGKSTSVQNEKDPNANSWTGMSSIAVLPSWRTNDELSFAVPPGSKHGSPTRPEIVLWSETGVRCLSKDWPNTMLTRLTNDSYKKNK